MLTVNGAAYKDVTPTDFNHYFSNTAMAWKLSPTKRRLFLVNTLDGDLTIRGSYLTRESLFKDKKLNFKEWWNSLDPIVLQPLWFNTPNGCAMWKHPLQKNLKKSFPWTVNCIRFFGKVTAGEKTLQVISRTAFSELYGEPKTFPGIASVLNQDIPARFTYEKFLVDRVSKVLSFYSRPIGAVQDDIIVLDFNKAAFKTLLIQNGVPESKISVQDKAAAPKPEDLLANKHMKFNPNWQTGYLPQLSPSGYAVKCISQANKEYGEYRTYIGKWPGEENLVKGWVTFNYWGQHLL